MLSNISFGVSGGETIGIIGPSGTGKSTLVQLLLQLRTPDAVAICSMARLLASLRVMTGIGGLAFVAQEPRLVHASVADNIRFFRDLDIPAIERAGMLARIHDDVIGWPEGYNTVVGPRADAVSGGQQQRICLARGLAALPEVLVLDEPTSALDPRSETLIHESLIGLHGDMTLFVIAHRIATLDICDRVLVVVDGQLEAFDTVDALAERSAYSGRRRRRRRGRGITRFDTSGARSRIRSFSHAGLSTHERRYPDAARSPCKSLPPHIRGRYAERTPRRR